MHAHDASPLAFEAMLATPFALAFAMYVGGVWSSRARRPWPWWRTLSWTLGLVAGGSGFVGPLAARAHDDVVAHMLAHLLVGMVAPLLLVLGAPVTLALRSLHVVPARRLSWLLRTPPARVLSSPIVAGVLSIGGMWLVYATPLHAAMRQDALVHLAVMTHMLLAGFVLTAAIAPVDPSPHRASPGLRLAVLVAASAAHGILAKMLYASPPAGVPVAEGRDGAVLMFYGGDAVDAALLTLLCFQWYRRARPRSTDPGGGTPCSTATRRQASTV